MLPHRFYLEHNDTTYNWEEYLAHYKKEEQVPGAVSWMCASIKQDDNTFTRLAVTFQGGATRLVAGLDRHRVLLAGVPHVPPNSIQWICFPDINQLWHLTLADFVHLGEEAKMIEQLADAAGAPPGPTGCNVVQTQQKAAKLADTATRSLCPYHNQQTP